MRNGDTPLINAEYNYWGAPDGPGNLGGSGDTYQGNVDADPWLAEPPDCQPDEADLELVKDVDPPAAAPGDPVSYHLSLANNGPAIALGVVLTDILPAEVAVQSVTSSGLVITDTGAVPPYVWQVQDIEPGAAGVITITAAG